MQPALATASNSGLPLVPKKRAQDAKARAAGMILVSPSGTALFLRRSGTGDHEGEWCLPAGVMEGGEDPITAAIRETREETGFVAPDDASPPVLADQSDEDVEFTTFARKVGNEFAPTLNDEHDGWAWAPLDKPPEPTHPGVKDTMTRLKDKLGTDAANEATEKELRTTIKFPPPRAGGGNSRAINTSFANGGGGTREKALKKASEAEAFENSGGLTKKDRTAKDAAPLRTLYARRNLLNAAEVEAWARGQGLVGVLSDMHVTIAYSKEPFDWTGVGTEGGDLSVAPSDYRVEQLGDEGAVVLRFQSKELSRRHRELKDAGAVWKYPSYKSHVTLTYQGGDELPGDLAMYEGNLVFGPEIFEEIDQEKRDAALKQSLVGDCATEVIAMDEEVSVRTYDDDGRLRVAVSNISKANVCPYLGSEIPGWEELGLEKDKIYKLFRDPDELAKAADSFNGIQLMMRHVPVNADDAQQWDVVGTTGTDAVFEAPYLKNSLVVWTRAGIEAVESERQKELSSAYHYTPDMTPGEYEGEKYDGVMRRISGNHLALVKEGRVGPDAVVGDSKEKINMKTNSEKGLSRTAGIALLTTAAFLRPRLAQDARLDLRSAFRGVTAKNYGEQKANVVAKISDLVRGKLAADSSIGEVAQLLDMIEKHGAESGEDDDMEEPMMDAAEEIGEKFAEPDSMDAEPLAEVESFLKDKLSDEDLAAVCSMLRGGETEDEDPKLDELGAADEDEQEKKDNAKTDKETNMDSDMEDRVKENKGAKDEPPPFKGKPKVGGAMDKNLVSKSAMDAALRDVREQTTQAIMKTQREVRDAEKRVRPWVGDISIACDSAEAVYKAALASLGVKGLDKIHPSAYSHVLDAQPLPGAKKQSDSRPAMDSASVASFAERFPGAARIGLA